MSIISTKVVFDKGENGAVITKGGEWVSGELVIELIRDGATVREFRKKVTRNGFAAWQEEVQGFTLDQYLEEYFPEELDKIADLAEGGDEPEVADVEDIKPQKKATKKSK